MDIGSVIKQSSFATNKIKAQINLIYTYNWLRDQHAPIIQRHGILVQHFNVMKIVKGRSPDPAYPSDILDVMLDKKPDLTRLVDKLVKKGLLDRRTCRSNRRKVEIFITDAGLDIVQEIDNDLKSMEGQINKLTEQEAGQLSDLLDKMRG